LVLAVAASATLGLIVDSVVFLYLAFGSLDYLSGQVLGKAWMVLARASTSGASAIFVAIMREAPWTTH
jgi:hypothetical protein